MKAREGSSVSQGGKQQSNLRANCRKGVSATEELSKKGEGGRLRDQERRTSKKTLCGKKQMKCNQRKTRGNHYFKTGLGGEKKSAKEGIGPEGAYC